MENIEKKIVKLDKEIESVYKSELVNPFYGLSLALDLEKLDYDVRLTQDKIIIENKFMKSYLAYNEKESIYYFSVSHKNKMIDYSRLLKKLKKEGFVGVDGSKAKIVIEGNSTKMQFSKGTKDGKEVDVWSYGSIRSNVIDEFKKMALYCSDLHEELKGVLSGNE